LRAGRILVALAVALCAAGCEYVLSDVATRIRYSLLDEMSGMNEGETKTIRLRPDHWPDRCPGTGGYRLVMSPYKGGKQVASGDIVVTCKGGSRSYYTGMGSPQVVVSRELTVEKRADEDLRVTLRRTAGTLEIVSLD